MALFIGGHEALEGNNGSRRCELCRTVAFEPGYLDFRGGGRHLGVLHLRGDGSLPDQVIELKSPAEDDARHLRWALEHLAGWANRLVRLLRVLRLAGVDAWSIGNHLFAKHLGGLRPCCRYGLSRKRWRIGSHVGDVTLLIQRLRGIHGLLRRHAKFARCLLLKC